MAKFLGLDLGLYAILVFDYQSPNFPIIVLCFFLFFTFSLLRNTASYMQTSNGQTKSAELVNQLIIYDGRERWGWYFGLSFDQPNQLPPQEVYSAELAQVGTKKSALVLQMENKRTRTVQRVILADNLKTAQCKLIENKKCQF